MSRRMPAVAAAGVLVLLAAALTPVAPAASAQPSAPGVSPARTAAAAPAPGGPRADPSANDDPAAPRLLDLPGPDGARVTTCADPSLLRSTRPGVPRWTLVCTQDPLHADDRDAAGRTRFRKLPMWTSDDLRAWRWVGEALPVAPPQSAPDAGHWAPELVEVTPAGGPPRWLLFFTITDVVDALSPEPGCNADSAIAVAVADRPTGPFAVQPGLVVAPRRTPGSTGCSFQWTFDPDLLVTPDGRTVLYFGSYGGGLFAVPMSDDGLRATGAPVQVAAGSRFEGPEVVAHGGWYHLFASSADCCNAELTGYSVLVARARDPFGPFVDRDGATLTAGRAGGTPFLVQDGDRWVGLGHNSVLQDDRGRWITAYHAIDRDRPRIAGTPLTQRPVLVRGLRFDEAGWPVLDGAPPDPRAGAVLWSDGFAGERLHPRWRWTPRGDAAGRPAAPRPRDGVLVLATSSGDLHQARNDAPLLHAALPAGPLLVEADVYLSVPASGRAERPVQAGLALLHGDDAYVKLVHVALQETRQTEFGIETPAAAPGQPPRYGNAVGAAPGEWTRLRVWLRDGPDGGRLATAYSRTGAGDWRRGATWRLPAGRGTPRLALLAMGGDGHQAAFRQVRVLRPAPR